MKILAHCAKQQVASQTTRIRKPPPLLQTRSFYYKNVGRESLFHRNTTSEALKHEPCFKVYHTTKNTLRVTCDRRVIQDMSYLTVVSAGQPPNSRSEYFALSVLFSSTQKSLHGQRRCSLNFFFVVMTRINYVGS